MSNIQSALAKIEACRDLEFVSLTRPESDALYGRIVESVEPEAAMHMTPRDYFAGQALAQVAPIFKAWNSGTTNSPLIAKLVYGIADAMIKERDND